MHFRYKNAAMLRISTIYTLLNRMRGNFIVKQHKLARQVYTTS